MLWRPVHSGHTVGECLPPPLWRSRALCPVVSVPLLGVRTQWSLGQDAPLSLTMRGTDLRSGVWEVGLGLSGLRAVGRFVTLSSPGGHLCSPRPPCGPRGIRACPTLLVTVHVPPLLLHTLAPPPCPASNAAIRALCTFLPGRHWTACGPPGCPSVKGATPTAGCLPPALGGRVEEQPGAA